MAESGINIAPETCAYCKGTGEKNGAVCCVCGGQGSVLVIQPSRKCGYCRGEGERHTVTISDENESIVDWDKCPACGGSGWAHRVRQESAEEHAQEPPVGEEPIMEEAEFLEAEDVVFLPDKGPIVDFEEFQQKWNEKIKRDFYRSWGLDE